MIRHPEVPFDPTGSLAVLICVILLPIFIHVILAFRLYVVLPRRSTSKTMLCIVFVPLALFKLARLINIGIFIKRLCIFLRGGNPAVSLVTGFDHFDSNYKIEWSLLVLDNW